MRKMRRSIWISSHQQSLNMELHGGKVEHKDCTRLKQPSWLSPKIIRKHNHRLPHIPLFNLYINSTQNPPDHLETEKNDFVKDHIAKVDHYNQTLRLFVNDKCI